MTDLSAREITRKANGLAPARKEIWLVNLGREHEETEKLSQKLTSQYRFKVLLPNLWETDFSKMDFSRVAAVDLKDCRGWQGNMDFFGKQLEILKKKIAETKREIPVINPPEVFYWIASKEYMKEIKGDVPMVPTRFVHRGDEWPDIFEMIKKNPLKKIVLKPAKGARAADVLFITQKDAAGNAFGVTCPNPTGGPTPYNDATFSKEAVINLIKGYRQKLFGIQQQPAILIQGYNPAKEISAVFVGSKAHYVERSRDSEHDVAHGDFGGIDILEPHPEPAIVKLAQKVKRSLPPHLSQAPYIRIDMFHDGVNPPSLLEIEAGSARLFLLEAGRVNDYAAMINKCVTKAQPKQSWVESSQRPSSGLANLL